MPGGFPTDHSLCNPQDVNIFTSTSLGAALTSGSSTNTPSAWSQLVASLGADCSEVSLTHAFYANGVESDVALDIAIGASGSEKIIVPSVVMCGGHNYGKYLFQTVQLPLQVPAGTRIAARYSYSNLNPNTVNPRLVAFDAGFTSGEGVAGYDAIGFQSASTYGTGIAPSATANTLGSWTQLIASAAKDYCGFFLCLDDQNSPGSIPDPASWLLNIGIGASGSEKVILPNHGFAYSGGAHWKNTISQFFAIPIPAGTRIAAQMQCNAASSPNIGVTLYGAYK